MADKRKVLALEIGKLTDPGLVRSHKLDSLGFYTPADPELHYTKGELFLVADGMQGEENGVRASRQVADVIIKSFYEAPVSSAIDTNLQHAFNLANMHIFNTNQSEGLHEAGVSATCAVIHRGKLVVAHAGATRLYLIQGNKIKQLTIDEPGNTRVLGVGAATEVDLVTQSLHPGDQVLLCSDGLYTALTSREIGSLALRYSPQQACEHMVTLAKKRGGQDNVTVIQIKVVGLVAIPDEFVAPIEDSFNLHPDAPKPTPRINRTTVRLEQEEPIEFEGNKESLPPLPDELSMKGEMYTENQNGFSDEAKTAGNNNGNNLLDEDYAKGFGGFPRRLLRRPLGAHWRESLPEWLPKAAYTALAVALILFIVFLMTTDLSFYGSRNPRPYATPIDSVAADTISEPVEALFEVEAEPEVPLRKMTLGLINGARLSAAEMTRLRNSLQGSGFENVVISQVNPTFLNRKRSKIIYRFPESGMPLPVLEKAELLKDTVSKRFGKVLEVVRSDISITIGSDFSLQNMRPDTLKKQMIQSENSRPVRVEILNGCGTKGLAGHLEAALTNVQFDNTHFVRVIDARNAAEIIHKTTFFESRPEDIALAAYLA
ncbi:SpoIIE family protein phosphatase, partial [bacterium]|nr:SpoIIE family protein phosphatase [bacterium]